MTVVLDRSHINDLQWESLKKVIVLTKQAHYTNVLIRINGRDEVFEADWIKHLVVKED